MASKNQFTAKALSKMFGISERRVNQLVVEGVITKPDGGKYGPGAVTDYIRHLKAAAVEKNKGEFSSLLEQEKYRAAKRENDLAEGLVAPVSVLEDVLARGVASSIPILEGLPGVMKRHWPEITGDQIMLVKQAVAEVRNALADVKIEEV